jgi:hypothetical protein
MVLVLAGFCSLTGFSQDLILKYGDTVVNSDSVYLSGPLSTELMEIKISVTNNRESAVSLKLRKTEIQLVEGAEASFCWGECYTPFVMVSPMAITIQAKGCDLNSFVGDYRPFGMEGTSIIKYTFFDPADTTYQQSVTVFFQIGGSGIDLPGSGIASVSVYPNPANDYVRVNLSEACDTDRTVMLFNGVGQALQTAMIQAGRKEISIPVADFPEGLYFIGIGDEKGSRTTLKIYIGH